MDLLKRIFGIKEQASQTQPLYESKAKVFRDQSTVAYSQLLEQALAQAVKDVFDEVNKLSKQGKVHLHFNLSKSAARFSDSHDFINSLYGLLKKGLEKEGFSCRKYEYDSWDYEPHIGILVDW